MKKALFSLVAFLTPAVSFAAITGNITNADSLVNTINNIFGVVIAICVSAAVVYLVFYIVKYFIAGEDDKKASGMKILYGIIGLFLILSIWGIVKILTNTFRTESNTLDSTKLPGLVKTIN